MVVVFVIQSAFRWGKALGVLKNNGVEITHGVAPWAFDGQMVKNTVSQFFAALGAADVW